MNERMNEWEDKWMNEKMNEWKDEWIKYERAHEESKNGGTTTERKNKQREEKLNYAKIEIKR